MLRLPFRMDGFLLSMLSAVVLALVYPSLGTSDGPLHLGKITSLGVSLVFFLHGAALSRQSLQAGISNWRLHLFIQTTTYIAFPLIGLGLVWLFKRVMPADLVLGLFYLCVLPSTISSSVAMTSVGRGNVPGAIFNASLSNLIGMVATPVLIGWMAKTGSAYPPLGNAVLDIALQLLLPFVLGQLLRPLLAEWILRYRAVIGKLDRAVVVLIVYSSFCDSTAAGLWHSYAWWMLVAVFALIGSMLAIVLVATMRISHALGFSLADEITAVFCGSKKSLATGMPMAKLLFAGHPGLGVIVLPLMFYHQLQLIVCAILARRYAVLTESNPTHT